MAGPSAWGKGPPSAGCRLRAGDKLSCKGNPSPARQPALAGRPELSAAPPPVRGSPHAASIGCQPLRNPRWLRMPPSEKPLIVHSIGRQPGPAAADAGWGPGDTAATPGRQPPPEAPGLYVCAGAARRSPAARPLPRPGRGQRAPVFPVLARPTPPSPETRDSANRPHLDSGPPPPPYLSCSGWSTAWCTGSHEATLPRAASASRAFT